MTTKFLSLSHHSHIMAVAFGAFYLPPEVRILELGMDTTIAVISIGSPHLHITARYMIVCLWKALKQHMYRLMLHNTIDTKADQVAKKRCNAQLLLSVDKGGCRIEFRSWGSRRVGKFLT